MRVLNPSGVEIDIPFWAFKRLKQLHLLERDRETGRRRIRAAVFGLMEIWEAEITVSGLENLILFRRAEESAQKQN
jgi:hypothetical protein